MEVIVTLRVSSSSLGIVQAGLVSPLARSSVHPQSRRGLILGRYLIKQVFVNEFHTAFFLNLPKRYVMKNFGESMGKMKANIVKSHILRKKVTVFTNGLEWLDRYF